MQGRERERTKQFEFLEKASELCAHEYIVVRPLLKDIFQVFAECGTMPFIPR